MLDEIITVIVLVLTGLWEREIFTHHRSLLLQSDPLT